MSLFYVNRPTHSTSSYCVFLRQNLNSGFTLIELLVVILVIGVLSAVALPTFLSQASKAQQSEAKTYIGSMNRAQQAEYMEHNSFSVDINDLGIGIASETNFYAYRITLESTGGSNVINRAIPSDGSFTDTPGTNATVKAYLGGVKIGTFASSGEATTLSIICEANVPPVALGDNGTTSEPMNLSTGSTAPLLCNPLAYKEIS